MKTLDTNDRGVWPSEKILRAKYYLSEVRRQRDPNNEKAAKLQQEVKASIKQSLTHEDLKEGSCTPRKLSDIDRLWDCRLVTP